MKTPATDAMSRQAGGYDRRWARYLDATLGPAVEALGGVDGRVVDLGAGTGELARRLRLSGFGGQVVGLDPSAAMLGVAARKGVANDWLIKGSADRIPLADATADACVSASALHAVRDAPRLLAEARRVLRPGGRLVLVDWSADYVSVRIRARLLRRFDPEFRSIYGLSDVCKLCESSGLRVGDRRSYRVGPTWGIYLVVASSQHAGGPGLPSGAIPAIIPRTN